MKWVTHPENEDYLVLLHQMCKDYSIPPMQAMMDSAMTTDVNMAVWLIGKYNEIENLKELEREAKRS